jgi:hypothetical protein
MVFAPDASPLPYAVNLLLFLFEINWANIMDAAYPGMLTCLERSDHDLSAGGEKP